MYKIIRSDSPLWNSYLGKFSKQQNQIHFTSEYHQLMEYNGDGEANLFVFEANDNIWFYPYMKRFIQKIDGKDFFDIASVFGYTGPLVLNENSDFINIAFSFFETYCNENNIIAELIRFNPVIDNQSLFDNKENYSILPLKQYVLVNTELTGDELLSKYKSRLRSYINKAAKKFGNQIKFSNTETEDLNSFYNLYKEHMMQLGASSYYLFSKDYYINLTTLIKKRGFLVYCKNDDGICAGLVFLIYGEVAYYHHGARNIHDPNSTIINKLLFHKALERLHEKGIKICVLGGGISHDLDDSLLRFKMGYNGYSKSFYLGKKIHNKVDYETVLNNWRNKFPHLEEKYANYIDKYMFSQ